MNLLEFSLVGFGSTSLYFQYIIMKKIVTENYFFRRLEIVKQ